MQMEKAGPCVGKCDGTDICRIYGLYYYEVKIGLGKDDIQCYNHIVENKKG